MSEELSGRDFTPSEGLFVFCLFLVCLSKGVPVSRWTYWGNFSLNKQLFTVFFQNLSRILSYFDQNTSIDCQHCVLSVKVNFLWRFFYLENYKQLDIFFRKSSGLSSQNSGRNYVLLLKVLRMIVKPRLYKFVGFFQRKRSFLGWMKLSRLFPAVQQMFFEFWKHIGKIVILSVQINFFSRKYFPEKKLGLIFFFRIRLEFFKSFVKKKNFQRKIVRRVIRTGLYAFRGTFRFLSFFGMCIRKASLCPDELIEEFF